MKDLIEAILKSLIGYIPMLAAVVANPRQNIYRLTTEPSEPLRHALVFCGTTIAIAFIAQAPLLVEGRDFMTTAGSLFAVKLFELLVFNALLMVLFKAFGGAGTYEQTLVASLYIVSPIYLFLVFCQFIGMGLLSAYDLEAAQMWRQGVIGLEPIDWPAFYNAAPGVAVSLYVLLLISVIAAIGWYLFCWQIYRKLHNLSRARSALAYIVAFALFMGIGLLRTTVLRGINGGTLPGIN